MMGIRPVVRQMLLCDNYEFAGETSRQINIYGLISTIPSMADTESAFLDELCVLLLVSDGGGLVRISLDCEAVESGELVFRTPRRELELGWDPLRLSSIGFRIQRCLFPHLGWYTMRFHVDGGGRW